MRWAVVETMGRRKMPRLIVDGVPEGTKRAHVLEVLRGAGWTARFSPAGVELGHHRLMAEERWPEQWDHGGRVESVQWARLESPRGIRLALDIPAALSNRLKLVAAAEGVSMAAWCIRQLEEGVDACIPR